MAAWGSSSRIFNTSERSTGIADQQPSDARKGTQRPERGIGQRINTMAKRKIKSERPSFRIIGDFNGLGGRMAKIDHKAILKRGREMLADAKAQDATLKMRMSCICSVTGMTKMDLATFIFMGLIHADTSVPNPLLKVEEVLQVVETALKLKKAGEIG